MMIGLIDYKPPDNCKIHPTICSMISDALVDPNRSISRTNLQITIQVYGIWKINFLKKKKVLNGKVRRSKRRSNIRARAMTFFPSPSVRPSVHPSENPDP